MLCRSKSVIGSYPRLGASRIIVARLPMSGLCDRWLRKNAGKDRVQGLLKIFQITRGTNNCVVTTGSNYDMSW